MVSWYNNMLTKQPLATKMVTCGILSAFGDMICQGIDGSKSLNVKRTVMFSLIGMTYIGPALHWNYSRFLPMMVADKGSATVVTVKKLMLD
jgi:hypothetical protein